ncbi:MAG TPA: hypothetical protein VEF04_07405 [Blastocatellia bacterium]|nr:hypothetical protein [Blastocatellia bacterium]
MAESQEAKAKPMYLYGLFSTPEQADKAYRKIIDMGYGNHSVGVIMAEETHNALFAKVPERDASSETPGDDKSGQGVLAMSATGAALGALAAIGVTIALPGIAVAGALATAGLLGGGMGAVAGSLFGGLLGSAVPKHQAEYYENQVKGGKILIRVVPESQQEVEEITREWEQIGGEVKQE